MLHLPATTLGYAALPRVPGWHGGVPHAASGGCAFGDGDGELILDSPSKLRLTPPRGEASWIPALGPTPLEGCSGYDPITA